MRSGGLLQRELERAGIPTISVSTVPELTERVCVPRAVFIQYPFGRILGEAGDRGGQRRVCLDMAELLEGAEGPNAYRHLPYAWPEPPEKTRWHPKVPAPIHLLRKKLKPEEVARLTQGALRDGERE